MNLSTITRLVATLASTAAVRWACGTSAVLAFCVSGAMAQSVLYKAGKVYTMTGPPLAPGQVLVVDGKIAAVGESLSVVAGTRTVDLGSATLIPGLVDAYNQTGLAGGTDEITRELTAEFSAAHGIDWRHRGLREALDQGTTTLSVAPGTENVIGGLACVIKTSGKTAHDRVIKGDGALVMAVCSDPSNRNRARSRPDGLYVRQPTNRMGVVWILRSTLDRLSRGEDIPSGKVIKQAVAGDREILAVSRTTYDIGSLLTLANDFGFSPIVVGGQEAHKIAASLASAKVPVILGPLTSGGLRGPEGSELAWNAAGILHQAGVTIALSEGNLLEQARFAHRFGLPDDAALKAVTLTPASLLGVDDRVGSIAPGLDADMVALNGEPLELTTSIRWVMAGGEIFETQEGN